MTDSERLRCLRKRHRRLVEASRAVVESAAQVADDVDHAVVDRYRLQSLSREVAGEPQHSAFATMSVS
jgi:hypothetical protein